MSKLIAVSGKGGVGKTTVAALLVRHLLRRELTPVFAVDADPNYTLGEALGIPVEQTIGSMREQFFGDRLEIPAGMSREAVLERNMHATLMESKGMDLLVMGRQEGPGCYCYLNNILRRFLDTLAADYRYVVVDNEAGMEHLSRRTTRKVDLMLVVADHSVKGARAARRIEELADELDLSIGHRALLINRVAGELAPEVRAEVERSGLELLAELPPDEGIAAADTKGQPLVELPEDNPFIQVLDGALERVLAKI